MEAIRNCCRAVYTYPVSREKLLILGIGFICVLLVGGLLVVICSDDDDEIPPKGSVALKLAPLIIGQNDLAANLKHYLKNQIKNFNFSAVSDNEKFSKDCAECCTDLTRLKSGMVSHQIWTVSTSDCVSSHKDAVSQTLEQIDVIQRLIAANSKNISLVEDVYGIKSEFSNSVMSSSIAVKGGHTIDGRMGVLRTYYNLGVRYLSFGGCNSPSVGWFSDTVLTEFGKKVVLEMNRLGMVIDISGLPLALQLDVIDKSLSPVIITNANAYSVCNSNDNVKDDVLDKLKVKDGIVMVSFEPGLIVNNKDNQTLNNVTLHDLLAHLTYLKTKVGAEHIGIGAGFDGFKLKVNGLEDISKLPALFDLLHTDTNKFLKWTIEELKGLAGNNFLRILEKVEKTAQLQKEQYPCDEYIDKTEFQNQTCYTDFTERYGSSLNR